MFADIRIALRSLVRNPAFTLTVVAVLAIGIGANSAIFGLVDQALFAPPGISDPGRVVAVRARYDKLNMASISISGPDFGDARSATDVFQAVAVAQSSELVYTGAGAPRSMQAAAVSVAWFDVYGTTVHLGRSFVTEEDREGADPVVVLAHSTWSRLFGSDPGLIGRTIPLNDKPYKVVGVMPATFRWPRQVDMWVPLALPAAELTPDYRFNEHLFGVARLKAGVSFAQANARVRALADRLRSSQDDNGAFARSSAWGMFVMPFTDYVAGDSKGPMLVLFGAVGFVLLIACSNIAGLLLARTASRAREIAIRGALGARRWQLLRQTLAESLILASAGAAAGLALSYFGMRVLIASAPEGAVIGLEPVIDWRVVTFTALAAIVAGVLFAVAPAWQVSRIAPYDYIKSSGRAVTVGRSRQRLRATLVVAETALAMVLLVGAGLLIRSLARLQDVSPGFNPRGVVAGGVALPGNQYKDAQHRAAFFRSVVERVLAAPGVEAAGLATPLPFTGNDSSASFQIEGQTLGPGDPGPHGRIRRVSPGYFAALGIPLRKGRVFTDDDRQGSEPVIVIDENLARQYWPDQDPIGRRMGRGGPGQMMTIVGIVGHISHSELVGETDKGTYYLCLLQQPAQGAWVVARLKQGLAEVPTVVSEAVRGVDPTLPVFRAGTMRGMISASLAPRRFVMRVLSFFAAVALLMAALGLYGVISYSVSQRTQEIGIRMALGAERRTVLGLVLGQGFTLAAIGTVIGIMGSAAANRLLASQLFGLGPFDVLTFATMAVVLMAAAILASYLPARVATRVDPLVALRCE